MLSSFLGYLLNNCILQLAWRLLLLFCLLPPGRRPLSLEGEVSMVPLSLFYLNLNHYFCLSRLIVF